MVNGIISAFWEAEVEGSRSKLAEGKSMSSFLKNKTARGLGMWFKW
jgi:hypothetical protein